VGFFRLAGHSVHASRVEAEGAVNAGSAASAEICAGFLDSGHPTRAQYATSGRSPTRTCAPEAGSVEQTCTVVPGVGRAGEFKGEATQ
jgi:hypothetical protein